MKTRRTVWNNALGGSESYMALLHENNPTAHPRPNLNPRGQVPRYNQTFSDEMPPNYNPYCMRWCFYVWGALWMHDYSE
jgi:hypothetical protein